MAILAFQKPDKVLMLEADSRFGKFEFRPLEPGFGITVGNALRRILLSSLEGFAITTIKIDGVEHEFSSVPGVKEDVTNIILNLKQVRFKQVVEEFESEKVSITIENSSEFKAGDIGKYLTGFEVLNPELVICHLDSKATMQIDITINKGRGYVPADENREYCTDVNVIPIDSIYTPIRNVKYQIEPFRVEQKTDYDKLVLEITTDGSIHPKEALKEAAKILIYHFMLFSDEKITLESNIMWTATWALNTLVACGKSTDWMVHMLGQAVGGYTNATHGMTLAAVSLPYYRHIMPYGLEKFKRFAVNVWGVDASEKEDREIAEEGLAAMESWMKELGLVMNLSELGVTEEMIEGIADVTIVFDTGYKKLDRTEIIDIFRESLI